MGPRLRGDDRNGSDQQIRSIGPFWIVFLDEPDLPVPIPLFQLLLALDCRFGIVECFDMNKAMDFVFADELRTNTETMLFKPLRNIVGYADIKRAVSTARKDVYAIGHGIPQRSSPRRRGPIATEFKSITRRSIQSVVIQSIHGVWVPACAGTTGRKSGPGTRVLRPLSGCPVFRQRMPLLRAAC